MPRIDVDAYDGQGMTHSHETDDEGRARFDRLAPGDVRVDADGPGWRTDGQVVVRLASASTKSIELIVLPTTVVSVTAVGPDGIPVAARLELVDSRGEVEWTAAARDEPLEFSVFPGLYTLRAQRDGRTVVRPIEVGEQDLAVELRFE